MDFINKIFKGDKVIWMIFAILCVISIIEVFSSASTLTYKSGDHLGPIIQHTRYLALGVVAMIIIQNIRYQWFKLGAYLLMPISLIMLICAILFGDNINGANRWLSFFGIQFQPSEIAKVALVCFMALVLSRNQREDSADIKALYIIGAGTGLFAIVIAMDNLSTAILICAVAFAMLVIGRIKWWTMIKALGVAIAGVLLLIGITITITTFVGKEKNPFGRVQTWVNRIVNHFDGDEKTLSIAEYFDKNGQRGHANIAIGTSNIVGVGPGNSVQRDFLSQAFSDFIYAIIIEELGLLGGGLVTLLYIMLLIRIYKISKQCQDRFSIFLIIGIGLMLVSQAMINMMVAVEILPVTGQPLPLVSKGGSSGIINCVMIGMILSVSYFNQVDASKRKEIEESENVDNIPEAPQSKILSEDEGFADEKK